MTRHAFDAKHWESVAKLHFQRAKEAEEALTALLGHDTDKKIVLLTNTEYEVIRRELSNTLSKLFSMSQSHDDYWRETNVALVESLCAKFNVREE